MICDCGMTVRDAVSMRDWDVERMPDGHLRTMCPLCVRTFVSQMSPYYFRGAEGEA